MGEEATSIKSETGATETMTVTATAGTETTQVVSGHQQTTTSNRGRGRGMSGRADLEFVFDRLGQMPTLRSVLLTRLDDEYRNYRQAIERTLASMVDMLRFGVEPLEQRVAELEARVNAMASAVPAQQRAGDNMRLGGLRRPGHPGYSDYHSRKERIRWGSEPDEIRANVLAHLHGIVGSQDAQIRIEVLRNQLPSALRWIYGKNAVFKGLDDLRRQYKSQNRVETPMSVTSPEPSQTAAAAGQASTEN